MVRTNSPAADGQITSDLARRTMRHVRALPKSGWLNTYTGWHLGRYSLGAAQAVLAVSVRHTSFPCATSSEATGRLLLDQMPKAN